MQNVLRILNILQNTSQVTYFLEKELGNSRLVVDNKLHGKTAGFITNCACASNSFVTINKPGNNFMIIVCV